MELLTSIKAINAGIASIKTRGATLQMDMHIMACSVLKHVGKNKDIRVLNRFIDAMPDMSRKNSLLKWFESFGNVAVTDGQIGIQHSKPVQLAKAMEKPFWKMAGMEGVKYVPINMAEELNKLVKKLHKDAKETKQDHSAIIKAISELAKTAGTSAAPLPN